MGGFKTNCGGKDEIAKFIYIPIWVGLKRRLHPCFQRGAIQFTFQYGWI